MAAKLIMTAVAMTDANFIFQQMTGQNWGVALERSFFQMIALFAVWLAPV